MRLEIITLCKAAVADHGALSILSAFDRLTAPKVPHVIPHCSVALRVRFERIEEGQHELKVYFIDVDGKNVMNPLHAKLGVNFKGTSRSSAVCLVIDANGLKFPAFGEYSIDVALDSVQLGSIPFTLVEQKNES